MSNRSSCPRGSWKLPLGRWKKRVNVEGLRLPCQLLRTGPHLSALHFSQRRHSLKVRFPSRDPHPTRTLLAPEPRLPRRAARAVGAQGARLRRGRHPRRGRNRGRRRRHRRRRGRGRGPGCRRRAPRGPAAARGREAGGAGHRRPRAHRALAGSARPRRPALAAHAGAARADARLRPLARFRAALVGGGRRGAEPGR